jgi:hypothetical protein
VRSFIFCKLRVINLARHLERIGEVRTAITCRSLIGNLKVRNCFVDLGVDGRITLKWILKSES